MWLIWNHEERRLRAGLRLVACGIALAMVQLGLALALRGIPRALGFSAFAYLLWALGVLPVVLAIARGIDRRPLSDLGLRPRRGYLVDLAAGALIGAMCIGSVAGIELATDLAEYRARAISLERLGAIGGSVVAFGAIALREELVSRGYQLVNLAEGLRAIAPRGVAVVLAVVLSSTVFGLLHLANPSASAASTAFIALAGVLLSIGMVIQGDLAMPIGLHFSWNLTQCLLHMPVSGLSDYGDAALVERIETGDDLITGGAFGPEAGLTGLFAMAVGAVLSLGWLAARRAFPGPLAAQLGASPTERERPRSSVMPQTTALN